MPLWFDDEITSVVAFREAVTLADLVELDLRRMFGADDTVVTFENLADALRVRLDETPLEQLEDELGWELAGALADPEAFSAYCPGRTCRRRRSRRARLASSPARDAPRPE